MAEYRLKPIDLQGGFMVEIINEKGEAENGEMEAFDFNWVINKKKIKQKVSALNYHSAVASEKEKLFRIMESDLEYIRTEYGEEMVSAIKDLFTLKIESTYATL
jgi:hypothetical protein